MYYTVSITVVKNLRKFGKMDGHMEIESAELHGKDLTESEDLLTVTDVLQSENPVILTVKDLQVQS